ncbi:hypothetical protein [Lysinibacillus sphaericus]|uniref:hypothetical protein n=1 Tax=Lysinibacillus sphaericus TaxID=1421 RepID=UPI0018CDDE9B|nr:hypothetical protein [Lysinibacillus sphaericus]
MKKAFGISSFQMLFMFLKGLLCQRNKDVKTLLLPLHFRKKNIAEVSFINE